MCAAVVRGCVLFRSRDPQSKIQLDRLTRQLESQLNTFQELLESEKKAARQHTAVDIGGTRHTQTVFMYSCQLSRTDLQLLCCLSLKLLNC